MTPTALTYPASPSCRQKAANELQVAEVTAKAALEVQAALLERQQQDLERREAALVAREAAAEAQHKEAAAAATAARAQLSAAEVAKGEAERVVAAQRRQLEQVGEWCWEGLGVGGRLSMWSAGIPPTDLGLSVPNIVLAISINIHWFCSVCMRLVHAASDHHWD